MKPYTEMSVNGYPVATDVFSFLAEVPTPTVWCSIRWCRYRTAEAARKLQGKAKRHGSMPDPSNKIAKADIEEVLNILAVDSSLLVNTNFNIIVSCPPDKVTPVTSFLETKLYECGIMPSRTAYNQLELFINSFPGCAYGFNPDYDLFLTLSDSALCLFFKEHLKGCEDTPHHILHRPSGTPGVHRHNRQGGQGEDDRQRQLLLHRAKRQRQIQREFPDYKQSVKDTFIDSTELTEPVYTMEEICKKYSYTYGRFYNLRMRYSIPCVKMDGHKCFPERRWRRLWLRRLNASAKTYRKIGTHASTS